MRPYRRFARAPALAVNIALASLACACSSGPARQLQHEPAGVSDAPGPGEPDATPAPGEARFNLVIESPRDRALDDALRVVSALQGVEAELAGLNLLIVLPYGVELRFTQCGEADASYDAAAGEIAVCYELVEALRGLAGEGQSADALAAEATRFVVHHELGHALLQTLELPLADVEQTADELATLILIRSHPDGASLAIGAARAFFRAGVSSLTFWKEHALTTGRLEDVACLAYGADPTGQADLIAEEILAEERADDCRKLYTERQQQWSEALQPYARR